MIIKETGEPPCTAKHIGTVQEVIAAKLSPSVTEKRISASDFPFGFELASPREVNSFGEAVVVNGECYATSTDVDSSDYYQMIHGPDFVTGGIFILPNEAKPTHQVSITEPLSLEGFYQALYQNIKQPFAFVGLFHFDEFHAMAIAKPPIDGKNIFDHKDKYYDQPEVYRSGVDAFVMAAASEGKQLKPYNLDTVLYQNPFDSESSLVYHAHALLLNKPLKEIEAITPDSVDQCLHLLNEGTTIGSGEARAFALKGTTKWDNS